MNGTQSGTAPTSVGPRVSQISGMNFNNSIAEFFNVVKTFRWSHRSQKSKRKFKGRNQRYMPPSPHRPRGPQNSGVWGGVGVGPAGGVHGAAAGLGLVRCGVRKGGAG